jgi:hypothetical protein
VAHPSTPPKGKSLNCRVPILAVGEGAGLDAVPLPPSHWILTSCRDPGASPRKTLSTRAATTCTKPVRRNQYSFWPISYSQYWFWTKSVPPHSCFFRAVALHSNGNQNMKPLTKSRSASRSRDAELLLPVPPCTRRQNLIASAPGLETDANA